MMLESWSFTGTRRGMTGKQGERFAALLLENRGRIKVFAHGCCVGSDIEAHHIVRGLLGRSVYIAVFPSTAKTRAPIPEDADTVFEPDEPLRRNGNIIALGRDRLVATPATSVEVIRSGTWHAIRLAKKNGVPCTILFP